MFTIPTTTTNNKDNTIIINGVEFMVDDSIAEAVFKLVSTGKAPAQKEFVQAGKKFDVHIEKIADKCFCIFRGDAEWKNAGWTRAEKNTINGEIKSKALAGGAKPCEYITKKGEVAKWVGFTTKAAAEKVVKTLQLEFTAEEIQANDKRK